MAGAAVEPPPQYTDPEAATMPAPEDISMSAFALAAAGLQAPAEEAPSGAASSSGSLPVPPSAIDPAAAALQAARIAEQIVGNIESASGAAIVAAAAAGAAIEAVRARGGRAPVEGELPPDDAAGTDPVVTVRMQRDRILRALAEDVAAGAASAAGAAATAAAAGLIDMRRIVRCSLVRQTVDLTGAEHPRRQRLLAHGGAVLFTLGATGPPIVLAVFQCVHESAPEFYDQGGFGPPTALRDRRSSSCWPSQ
jgi:hypothetical protein